MISATAPNWQSEISKANHRGAAVIAESIFISLGLAVAGWIDLGFSFTTGSVEWRFPFGFSSILAIFTIIFSGMFPESPRWLLKRGRVDEAREVLAVLDDSDPNGMNVQAELAEIQESLALAGKGSFASCFRNGELRLANRTVLACSAQMFQQLCGINALAFYLSTIFQTYLNLSGVQSGIVAASVFTFQTLCAPIGVLTVERLGRRKLMIISAAGMGTCMAIVAGCTSQGDNKGAEAVAGAMIFLFSFFFPIGFLGMTFLYASEIAPLNVRVQITALSTASAWIFNFLVSTHRSVCYCATVNGPS
jgi:MFS family permease